MIKNIDYQNNYIKIEKTIENIHNTFRIYDNKFLKKLNINTTDVNSTFAQYLDKSFKAITASIKEYLLLLEFPIIDAYDHISEKHELDMLPKIIKLVIKVLKNYDFEKKYNIILPNTIFLISRNKLIDFNID